MIKISSDAPVMHGSAVVNIVFVMVST